LFDAEDRLREVTLALAEVQRAAAAAEESLGDEVGATDQALEGQLQT
jgi:hypothetical protein